MNESFELDSYSNGNGNFDDNYMDSLFNSMDYDRRSMDYDRETQSLIQEINNTYFRKKQQLWKHYQKERETTIRHFCFCKGVYLEFIDSFSTREFFFTKNFEEIKKYDDKYKAQFATISGKIDYERINAVNNFAKKRSLEKEKCLSKKPLKIILPEFKRQLPKFISK